MGMFDWFRFRCPNCGELIEEQSKAGPCELNEYTVTNCDRRVAADLIGKSGECRICGYSWVITEPAQLSIE